MSKLPVGWGIAALGDFCVIHMGQSPPSTTYNETGHGLPFFQGKAEFGDVHPTARKWCTQPTRVAEAGDVLVSVRAPVGPTNIASERSAIGRGLATLRPMGGIASRFILYAMRAYEHQLVSMGTGSTFTAIGGEILRSFQLPVPPLAEQRRIVAAIEEHLSRLDAAVTGLERVLAQLPRYRAAVLKAAVEGRLLADEDHEEGALVGTAPDNHRAPDISSDDDQLGVALPALPPRWVWTTMGRIGRLQGGIQKQPKRTPVNNRFPFLRVANVGRGRLDLSDVHEIELFGDELNRLRLQRGDLLIVEGNGSPSEIGRMAVWDGSIADCVHQNHLIRHRPTTGVLPEYVEAYWNSPDGARRVAQVASSTSGLFTLSVSKIAALPIPVPPADEQRRITDEIARRMSVLDAFERETSAALGLARSLRQSILRRAFAGQLVPQDPNDEPASVLLERIRAERAAVPARRATGRRRKVAL